MVALDEPATFHHRRRLCPRLRHNPYVGSMQLAPSLTHVIVKPLPTVSETLARAQRVHMFGPGGSSTGGLSPRCSVGGAPVAPPPGAKPRAFRGVPRAVQNSPCGIGAPLRAGASGGCSAVGTPPRNMNHIWRLHAAHHGAFLGTATAAFPDEDFDEPFSNRHHPPGADGLQGGLLPRSTKGNAYVGVIRHAPATTNGLKDLWGLAGAGIAASSPYSSPSSELDHVAAKGPSSAPSMPLPLLAPALPTPRTLSFAGGGDGGGGSGNPSRRGLWIGFGGGLSGDRESKRGAGGPFLSQMDLRATSHGAPPPSLPGVAFTLPGAPKAEANAAPEAAAAPPERPPAPWSLAVALATRGAAVGSCSGRREWLGEVCVICLGAFEPGDALQLLQPCAHAFHASCIARWERSGSSSCGAHSAFGGSGGSGGRSGRSGPGCPTCRAPLFPPRAPPPPPVPSPSVAPPDEVAAAQAIPIPEPPGASAAPPQLSGPAADSSASSPATATATAVAVLAVPLAEVEEGIPPWSFLLAGAALQLGQS